MTFSTPCSYGLRYILARLQYRLLTQWLDCSKSPSSATRRLSFPCLLTVPYSSTSHRSIPHLDSNIQTATALKVQGIQTMTHAHLQSLSLVPCSKPIAAFHKIPSFADGVVKNTIYEAYRIPESFVASRCLANSLSDTVNCAGAGCIVYQNPLSKPLGYSEPSFCMNNGVARMQVLLSLQLESIDWQPSSPAAQP